MVFPSADQSLFYDNGDPQFKTARIGYLRITNEKSRWHSRMPHLENDNFRAALAEALELAERKNLIQTAAENEKVYANGGRFVLENKDYLFAFRCMLDVKYCFVYDKKEVQIMPNKMMKVVMVEPHKPAYMTEIGRDYKSLQKAVGGGLIEPIYFLNERGVVMVGNEEAKLLGMDGNRRFEDGIVAGPFIICGDNGEDFCSLTDEQCEKYVRQFAEPEQITRQEVEDDMKIEITFF